MSEFVFVLLINLALIKNLYFFAIDFLVGTEMKLILTS